MIRVLTTAIKVVSTLLIFMNVILSLKAKMSKRSSKEILKRDKGYTSYRSWHARMRRDSTSNDTSRT